QDIDLIDILWRQDIDLGAGREIFDYSHRQKESEVDKELSDGRERGDSWRSAGHEVLDRIPLVDGETGESFPAQVPGAEDQTALSLEECLRLLEATFPFGDNSEVSPWAASPAANWVWLLQEAPGMLRNHPGRGGCRSLKPPGSAPRQFRPWLRSAPGEPCPRLLQAMEVNGTSAESLYGGTGGDLLASSYSLAPGTPINQNVSLHQASLGSCSQDFSLFSSDMESPSMAGGSALLQLAPDNSTGLNGTFGSTNLSGIFFP
ncbi:NF2L1 protein, partial [Sylvietta virens]|nr:NF2L1 protein [Sylvietta virens]